MCVPSRASSKGRALSIELITELAFVFTACWPGVVASALVRRGISHQTAGADVSGLGRSERLMRVTSPPTFGEHCFREAGAGGSNPLTPTNSIIIIFKIL